MLIRYTMRDATCRANMQLMDQEGESHANDPHRHEYVVAGDWWYPVSFPTFFIFEYLGSNCVWACGYEHMGAGCHGDQKRTLNSFKLESQTLVSPAPPGWEPSSDPLQEEPMRLSPVPSTFSFEMRIPY